MQRQANGNRKHARRAIRVWLSCVLLAAAGVHFVAPEFFSPSMPPAIPFHDFWIAFTGLLELLAAVGLWLPSLRRATSYCLMVYFVAILPAHFYVAMNDIPMFGLRNPWLWIRIPFQAVFIGAAWISRKGDDESIG